MSTVILQRAPVFQTVRSVTGAVAADSATVSTTNYPPADAMELGQHRGSIEAYWGATNAADADWLDLQLLIYDGVDNCWVLGPIHRGVKAGAKVSFPVGSGALVYLRVLSASVHAGVVDLEIRAAAAH